MSRTERFREQHATFLKQVTEVSSFLGDEAKVKSNAAAIRGLLSQLAGGVRLHLATEDQTLYPELAKSPDVKVAAMAKRFQTEMGGIKNAFEDYSKKWTAAHIEGHANEFITESKAVFEVLGKRIAMENTELYAAADKIAG